MNEGIIGQSYVLLEDGVPWLAQRMPAPKGYYLKIKQFDEAELGRKIGILKQKQEHQSSVQSQTLS